MTVSLSQITALVLVYRRLVVLFALGPTLAVVLPLALRLLLFLLNIATADHAGVTVVLTSGLILTAAVAVQRLASTPKSRQRAWKANRRKLPWVVVVNGALARFVVGPFAQWCGLDWKGPFGLATTWGRSIWLAVVLVLLEMAVVFRFVGSKSVRKCRVLRRAFILSRCVLL